jgi:hypothetical protein
VNNDGRLDLVVAAAGGNKSYVRVLDGATLKPLPGKLGGFTVPGRGYTHGVHVACADLNADGFAEIVTGNSSGPAAIRIFDGQSDGANPLLIKPDDSIEAGAQVAIGDVDADGLPDLVFGTMEEAYDFQGTIGVVMFCPNRFLRLARQRARIPGMGARPCQMGRSCRRR